MALLLITLPTGNYTDTTKFDYVLSDDGRSVRTHTRCPAAQLPRSNAASQEVVAVVPGSALSWHQVQLPAGTLPARLLRKDVMTPRLRAVLEGLLEDQLLDDPAQLHFALQPDARADGPVWVGVCDRPWLHSALGALQQVGCTPHRVVPEWAPKRQPSDTRALRKRQPTLWATGTPEAARLVWADVQGVHVVPFSLAHGLSGATSVGPQDALLLAEPDVAKLTEQVLRQEVTIVAPAKRILGAAASRWNLAQGGLTRRSPLLQSWAIAGASLWNAPQWRPARFALAALVLTQLIGINAWALYAQAQLDKTRTAMRATLLASFPQVGVVIDAPAQMQKAVNTLRTATGGVSKHDMETLLGALGNTELFSHGTVTPSAIDFAPGELRVKVPGLSPEIVSTLDRRLQAAQFAGRLEAGALVVRPRSTP